MLGEKGLLSSKLFCREILILGGVFRQIKSPNEASLSISSLVFLRRQRKQSRLISVTTYKQSVIISVSPN